MARPQRLHPRRRAGVPHLLHQFARRRGDGIRLELSGHDGTRPSGNLGGFAGWLPPKPAVQVVELARQLRSRCRARPEVGQSLRRRGGRVPEQGRRHQGMTGTEIPGVYVPPGARLEGEDTAAAVAVFIKWLRLAATPAFAIMALLTGLMPDQMDYLCS